MKLCNTCTKEIKSRRLSLCDSCYHKDWWAKNKPEPKIKERSPFCLDCGIDRERHGRSVKYCNSCALKRSLERNPEILQVRRIQARNYQRKKKGIDITLPRLTGEFGKGHLNKYGYRILSIPNHPNATTKKGAIAEHTYLMSLHLGRPLKKGESVHHKNGLRDDNRIENLELWHKGQPPGQRLEDKIEWAIEFLKEYGYEVSRA